MNIKTNIQSILGRTVKTRNRAEKIKMISEAINTSRYEIISAFPGGGNTVTLRPRFHNKRDKRGRFTRSSKR